MWFLTKLPIPPRSHHRNTQAPQLALAWGSCGQGVGILWEIEGVPLGSRLQLPNPSQFPKPSLEIAKPPHGALITP